MSRSLYSLPLIFTVLLIVLLPSYSLLPFGYHDEQRLVELIILGLICIGFFTSKTFSPNIADFYIFKKIRLSHLLASVMVLGVASSSQAFAPQYALLETAMLCALCGFSLYISDYHARKPQNFTLWVSYALLVSLLLYLINFFTGYLASYIQADPINWPLPFSGFSNIRSFNQYQIWTMGLVYLPLLLTKNSKTKLALILILSLWWTLLFYSASRGAILALTMALLFCGILFRGLAVPFARWLIISCVIGLCLYWLFFYGLPHWLDSQGIFNTMMREGDNGRGELWLLCVQFIHQHPLLGIGPMQYAWNSQTYGHPHNSILQLYAEWGIVAASIICCIGFTGFIKWISGFNRLINTKNLDTYSQQNIILLTFSLTAGILYSLVDGVIVMPISQVMMFFVIGLMIGQYRQLHSASNALTLSYTAVKITFFSVFAVIIFVVYPDVISGIKSSTFSSGQSAPGTRFWLEGLS